MKKRLVVLESPYRGKDDLELIKNQAYARRCVVDSLKRNEAPIASHVMYAMSNILDDGDPHERNLGIGCGLAWQEAAAALVVYTDLGISKGMHEAINFARDRNIPVEYRTLPGYSEAAGK